MLNTIDEREEIRGLSAFDALQRLVKAIDADRYLADTDRFRERSEVLDLLDAFDLDSQVLPENASPEYASLRRHARRLQVELENANHQLYERIRDSIRSGCGRNALLRCAAPVSGDLVEAATSSKDSDSYGCLDELVSGVLQFSEPPKLKMELSPEMVAYQPTPARHIFELSHRMKLEPHDVFVDLGSGLGHVPLLVAACTDAQTVGVEIEPSYVEVARRCVEELHLKKATFVVQDVRDADLSGGTIFYLYTPFRGTILRAVLDRLRFAAGTREIRVCTFGPCTPVVAAESWLGLDANESGSISVFRTRG